MSLSFALALVATILVVQDFARTKRMGYFTLGYVFLAAGALSFALADVVDSYNLIVLAHFFGITMAGLLFARAAFAANRRAAHTRRPRQ